FHPDEIEVIALVARYHRRGMPKKTHDEYASLPATLRRVVRLLASILRIAESLDRSHGQMISALELRDRGKQLEMQLQTQGDAELEVWATTRHLQVFERLVGKPVRIEVATRQAADTTPPV